MNGIEFRSAGVLASFAVGVLAAASCGSAVRSQPPDSAGHSALAVIEAQMHAFNRHDAAALAAGVSPNFIWLSVSGDEVTVDARGRAELERGMAAYFAEFPDVRSTIEDAVVNGRFASVRERVRWTGADGERSQAALAVYEVEDGLIRRVWYYPAVRDEAAATESFVRSGVTDPERSFAEIEDRLLSRPDSRIGFRITSEGAFAAALEGELFLGAGNEVALKAEGTFGSDSVSLWLDVVDGQLIGGNTERTFRQPVPAELREAIVIGMTRMGLLHNLARLVSGAPPDRADGTVRGWVEVRAIEWTTQDQEPGSRGLSFELWVDEQTSGDAVLWLDARGLPVARDQIVRFPGGEMRVREEYEIP